MAMRNLEWRGGTSTAWNTAANWYDLDAAADAAAVPTNIDVLTVNAHPTNIEINLITTIGTCKSLDLSGCTEAGHLMTLSGNVALSVYGSLILQSGMTWSLTGGLRISGTGNLDSKAVLMSSVASISIGYYATAVVSLINNAWNIGSKAIYFASNNSGLITNNLELTCGLFTDNSSAVSFTLTLGSSTINCANVSFAAATLTVTHTGALNITTTADIAANFGGKTWGGTITCLLTAGKKLTLGDSPTFGNFVWSQGTFELNGKTLTCGTFDSSNTNTRIIQDTPGTGKIVVTGLTGTIFNMATVTNLTVSNAPAIDIGTSNLTLTGDVTFAGGGKTFGNFKVSKHAGDFDCIVTGANTFGIITLETPDATYQFSHLQLPAGVTTTCTGFVSDGTASYQNSLLSSSAAAHTLSDTAGTNTVTYTTIAYSQAEGGATWTALESAGNLDGGNNTGWVFTSSGSLIGSLMLMGIGR